MDHVRAYIPQDRYDSLVNQTQVPQWCYGVALFVDISGFTQLTEKFRELYGESEGAEHLSEKLNSVYHLLISEIENYQGNVISFAGDAITVWFTGNKKEQRSLNCALVLQNSIQNYNKTSSDAIAIKIGAVHGLGQRLVLGDEKYGLLDVLLGHTLHRLACAEKHARKNEIVVDSYLAQFATVAEWLPKDNKTECFARLKQVMPSIFHPPIYSTKSLANSMLSGWVLPDIYDNIIQSNSEMINGFRSVTALFMSFSGIDYDQDLDTHKKLQRLVAIVQKIIHNYHGAIIQLTFGDKGSFFYITFGAPQSSKNNRKNAVFAAQDLREKINSLGYITDLRIGMSSGQMFTGIYGSYSRCTYGVLGSEVNIAARLMGLAEANQILVRKIVADGVTQLNWQELPARTVKGIDNPIPTYLLQQSDAIDLDKNSTVSPLSKVVIGRQKELVYLEKVLKYTLQSKSWVVCFVGDAGIGKTELAQHALLKAKRYNIHTLHNNPQNTGAQASYQPYAGWKNIILQLLDIKYIHLNSNPEQHISSRLSFFNRNLKEYYPLIGDILGLDIEDNALSFSRTPEIRSAKVLYLITQLILTSSRLKPILLVLEDIHNFDKLSLDLLFNFMFNLSQTPNYPISILVNFRPSEDLQDKLEKAGNHILKMYNLSDLSFVEFGHLCMDIIKKIASKPLKPDEEWLKKVYHQVKGNPLFIENYIPALYQKETDSFLDPSQISASGITLQEFIQNKIDAFDTATKTMIRASSVVGNSFSLSIVRGYYPTIGDLLFLLNTSKNLTRNNVFAENPKEQHIFSFYHNLTHDVTYQGMTSNQRSNLHEKLAYFLENNPSQHITLADLTYHYSLSKKTSKKREYFKKSAEYFFSRDLDKSLEFFNLYLENATGTEINLANIYNFMARIQQIKSNTSTLVEYCQKSLKHSCDADGQAKPEYLAEYIDSHLILLSSSKEFTAFDIHFKILSSYQDDPSFQDKLSILPIYLAYFYIDNNETNKALEYILNQEDKILSCKNASAKFKYYTCLFEIYNDTGKISELSKIIKKIDYFGKISSFIFNKLSIYSFLALYQHANKNYKKAAYIKKYLVDQYKMLGATYILIQENINLADLHIKLDLLNLAEQDLENTLQHIKQYQYQNQGSNNQDIHLANYYIALAQLYQKTQPSSALPTFKKAWQFAKKYNQHDYILSSLIGIAECTIYHPMAIKLTAYVQSQHKISQALKERIQTLTTHFEQAFEAQTLAKYWALGEQLNPALLSLEDL